MATFDIPTLKEEIEHETVEQVLALSLIQLQSPGQSLQN